MLRRLVLVLILLASAGQRVHADNDLELAVLEVERLSRSASSEEIRTSIEALRSRPGLSAGQRQRLEYVRLRQLGIAGEPDLALSGLTALLEEGLELPLRVRVLDTAISMAANAENWPQAFAWLNEILTYLPDAPGESPSLFGAASYLYAMVGEDVKAREMALRALHDAEKLDDAVAVCRALAGVALAEDLAGNFPEAQQWRARQIDACERAQDGIFSANGKYGFGKMAARQGHYEEALEWTGKALAEFEEAGFAAGAYSTRLVIAESLIALRRELDRAATMLADTVAHYQQHRWPMATAEAEELRSRLAELQGDAPLALAHLKASMQAAAEAEQETRKRRLAYLQVQFETELKEHEITLLQTERQLAAARATAVQRRQGMLAVGAGGLLVAAVLLAILLRRSARERRRYRWQSEHDSLTGLYNYQQARTLGDESFDRARATGSPFTAVMIDIDLFKQVNDRYGHAAGDAALRALGKWIRQVLEESGVRGIAGRSGGDEFTLFLEADGARTDTLLQRLRGCIEPITVFGRTFRFHISAGMAEAGGAVSTLEQLVHEADQALYRAKQDGRDRIAWNGAGGRDSARGGGLVVVGSGIEFGRHASARCLSEIQAADVVFCLADPAALAMISASRPDTINLGLHYAPGKDRRQTYREIEAAILEAVRSGRRVCAVFYGHPGVFADVPHRAIRKARAEGFPARMEPGISAEACLYADLGMDPGARGVQSLEATHFLCHDRQLDPHGLVLLWQVALSGDFSCTRTEAETEGLQALTEKLMRWYPADHEVILYEAAQLPIDVPRMERLPLRDLPHARYREFTTLVIPPAGEPRRDPAHEQGTEAQQV